MTASDGASRVASVGWGTTLNGNGADIYFPIATAMVVDTVDIDTSFVLPGVPSQAAPTEVLYVGSFVFGGAPQFAAGPAAFYSTGGSQLDTSFGNMHVYNPNNTTLVGVTDGQPVGAIGSFFGTILKAFAPLDGTSAHSGRQVHLEPNQKLSVGDYIVLHMDTYGPLAVQTEMHAQVGYHLS